MRRYKGGGGLCGGDLEYGRSNSRRCGYAVHRAIDECLRCGAKTPETHAQATRAIALGLDVTHHLGFGADWLLPVVECDVENDRRIEWQCGLIDQQHRF